MLDIRLDPAANGALPIYRQLADQIEFLIRSGELPHGERLPSTRDLSRQLGISRGAVVQAYEELCSRNLCASHVGRGTEVVKTADSAGSLTRVLAASEGTLLAPDEPIINDPRSRSLLPSVADTAHLPVSELRQSFGRVLRYPGLKILVSAPAVIAIALSIILGDGNLLSEFWTYCSLFFALCIASLGGRLWEATFSRSWWGFTFPMTALSSALIRLYQARPVAFTATLAVGSLIVATGVVTIVAAAALRHGLRWRATTGTPTVHDNADHPTSLRS